MAGSITPAAIYHLVDDEHPTLLVDEADNLDTKTDRLLKSVLNNGWRRGSPRLHWTPEGPREFDLYTPMALASIGHLPLPLMQRSIVIEMKRATRRLQRFDPSDAKLQMRLTGIRRELIQWAQTVILAKDPEMPPGLINRLGDNWRVLISIADSVGGEWPERARTAAVALSKDRPDEDPGVVLLIDIRGIFDRRRVDRHPSLDMVKDLIAIEDGLWAEWRGIRDDQQPRNLSQGELARLLAPFRIRPKSIWPTGPRVKGSGGKGYRREWFEQAWQSYCPQPDPSETGTAAQPSNIRYLQRPKGGT
jgi:hypothetical protein